MPPETLIVITPLDAVQGVGVVVTLPINNIGAGSTIETGLDITEHPFLSVTVTV